MRDPMRSPIQARPDSACALAPSMASAARNRVTVSAGRPRLDNSSPRFVSVDAVRPERNGALEMRKRLVAVAAQLKKGAKIVVRLRVVGVDSERLSKLRDRFVPAPARRQGVAEVVMR